MSYSVFPEILFLIVFSFIFIWISSKCKSEGTKKASRILWTLLLTAYAAILIWKALMCRAEGYEKSLNLNLFSSYRFILIQYNSFDVFKQIIDNILVFVPLGILLPAAYGAKHEMKNYVFVVFSGLFVSLLIETLQYVFAIGFTEADDVINNVWGCMVGCGIYAFSGRIECKKESIVIKKGWVNCLMPLITLFLAFGIMWCYREFILCTG